MRRSPARGHRIGSETSITRDQKRRLRRHIENLDSSDEEVSSKAETYLMRYYGVRALDELLNACGHPNPVVRFRAAWVLGHTGAPEAYEAILCLTDDPDERVRYDATVALGVLDDMRAVQPLIRMWLKNDYTRPAAMAFSRLGVKALPAIEEVLHRGNADVRNSAVQVLGGFAEDHGDARAVELLQDRLNDPDALVREDAKFWLEEIGRMAIGGPTTAAPDAARW